MLSFLFTKWETANAEVIDVDSLDLKYSQLIHVSEIQWLQLVNRSSQVIELVEVKEPVSGVKRSVSIDPDDSYFLPFHVYSIAHDFPLEFVDNVFVPYRLTHEEPKFFEYIFSGDVVVNLRFPNSDPEDLKSLFITTPSNILDLSSKLSWEDFPAPTKIHIVPIPSKSSFKSINTLPDVILSPAIDDVCSRYLGDSSDFKNVYH